MWAEMICVFNGMPDWRWDLAGCPPLSLAGCPPLSAINGLSDISLAPQDTIRTSMNFVVTPDGKVGMDSGGVRTAYPSIEIYSYSPSGKATTIYQRQESGNLGDLRKQNQPIPKIKPR